MSRRRQRQSAFSLFAFQDIITAVTGIMLLITLLLTLELVGRREKAIQAEETVTHATDVSADPDRLEQEIAALRRDMAELKSDNAMFAKYDERQLRNELRKAENENLRRQEKLRRLKQELADARRRQAEARATPSSPETIEQTEREIHDTAVKLETLRKSGRIFMQAARGSQKTNWLLEISKTGAEAAAVGRQTAPMSFPDAHAFRQWLETRNRAADHLVLLVKPDGISLFKEIARLIDTEGFSKGFDVLQPGDTVLDDQTGAAVP